ncbi:MAG: insulinase family protein [Phycisphaeraceae bacterium]|nr:insulinase family protein [Phycisphaeraceae bacterium]
MMTKFSLSLFCLTLTLIAAAAFAAESAPEYTVLQQRSDRLIVQLPNRMMIVAQHLPTAPVVSAQIWVKTGSLYEQEHVGAGLSHFLEHLLSAGTTEHRTEKESNAELGRIGAQTNAATSLDTVRYYINTTSDHAPEAIDLLSDWMGHSLISQSEYERERDVIQREFDMGRGDPGRIFWKLTQQARYSPDHPAAHPTIGYLSRFLEISRDEINDFYHRMYAPNNLLFVVVGDIDPRKVVEQITAHWADAEPRKLPTIHVPMDDSITPGTSGSTAGGGGKPVVGYADIAKPRVRLIWPGTMLAQPGDYEMDLLAGILGQGESSRLAHTVRDQQRAVTSIVAHNSSFTWGRGLFAIDMEPAGRDEQSVQTAIDASLEQVRQLAEQPVSDEELARAKRRTLAGVLLSTQSAQTMAARLANDIIGTGDPDYLTKYAQAVQSLTAEQLQKIAQQYLDISKLIVVKLLPADADHPVTDFNKPDEQTLTSQTQNIRDIDIDNSVVAAKLKENLAESDARPIAVDEPTTSRLDNGLTLIVQRSTVVPGVSMHLYTLGGLLADEPESEGVAYATAAMLDRGTTTRTADQIHSTIEGLGASLTTEAGNNTTYVQANCLAEDWPTVMSLMADVVLHPTFPDEEWSKLQPRLLAAIDRETDSWAGELRSNFLKTYYQGYPWSQSPTGRRDVVEKLTASDLAAFHKHQFTGRNSVLSVVGDVDPAKVEQAVREMFKDLPVSDAAFTPPQPKPPMEAIETFRTEKPLTAVEIGLGPGMTRDDPHFAAMQVLTAVMSDFPTGWLDTALRGDSDGLVYAVGAGTRVGIVPGFFAILFNTDAAKTPEAINRAMQVVGRAKRGEFDAQNIQRAKARVISDELLEKQDNSARAANLALDVLYQVPEPGMEAFKQQVDAVDAEALREVARRYLLNPVTVVISNGDLSAEAIYKAIHPLEPMAD